jgi:hypothetical protein
MGSTKNTDFSLNHSRPYHCCPEQLFCNGKEGSQGDVIDDGDCQLTLLIIDPDHHGESGPQGDDTADRTGPGSLPVLYLHPTIHVVS